MTPKILVIEDDQDIAALVRLHLRDLGYAVDVAADGPQGLEQALSGGYGLVVLDVMLPGVDGLEICRRLRAQPDYPWILMLTARSSELDRVLGLEMGADDYLTKPFSIRELLARVKGLFRRAEVLGAAPRSGPADAGAARIRRGALVIDPDKRLVALGSLPVGLTSKEFDLLLLFASHPGRVYSRAQLLDLVWGTGYEGHEHTVNSHINRLRAKLEADPAHPVWERKVSSAKGRPSPSPCRSSRPPDKAP